MTRPHQLAWILAALFACVAGCTVFLDTSDFALEDAAPSDADPGETDTTFPDTDTTGTEDASPTARNGCGGRLSLAHAGTAAEPGEACGDFGEGVLACASLETLTCRGRAARNACGGTGVLPVELGEACGICDDGLWACDDAGGVTCLGAQEPNGCGGCDALGGRPGGRCEASGELGGWVCTSRDTLVCLAGAQNACGGENPLQWEGAAAGPGQPCDSACGTGDGVLVCGGEESLECALTSRAQPLNVCGGCGPLPGVLGGACGVCGGGVWACDGESGSMVCDGGAMVDACGGCSGERGRPGEACGAGFAWLCEGEELLCAPIVDDAVLENRNACGGTIALTETPGAACGDCGRGELVCATQNRLACEGDAPGNVCGGCEPDAGRVGDACGVCGSGSRECEGTRLVCVGNLGSAARNACEGCGTLGASPGDVCGTCLSWQCTGTGGLRCEADVEQEGCGELLTCEDLECEEEGRRCEASDGEVDATCGGCLAGHEEVDGECVEESTPVRSCAEAGCADEDRECVQPTAETDATCGDCLAGYEEVDGVCVEDSAPVRSCAEAGCADEDRECVQPNAETDATCGACLAGYEEVDGVCVEGSVPVRSCAEAGCADENRECIQPTAETDATCGACLQGFEEVNGNCLTPLGIPAGVTASQGTSEAHVAVSWQSVAGATGYHVYRDGTRVTTTPLTSTSYNDTGAPAGGVPGTVFGLSATNNRTSDIQLSWNAPGVPSGASATYQVRAIAGAQQSELSSWATGFRSGRPLTRYEVQVGSGSWVALGTATSWTDPDAPAGSLTVGTPTATTTLTARVDLAVAVPGTTLGVQQGYRVRAVNASGAGEASSPALGNRSVGTLGYQWQWSTTSGGSYSNLSGATSRTVSDNGIAAGATRWYRVVVSAAGASPVTSSAVEGRRVGSTVSLGSTCTADSQCPAVAWCPTNTSERRCSPRPEVGGVQMPFQWVPRGAFTMGSPSGEVGRNSSREAQVEVTFSRDYFVQRTPVTQGQWGAVMEAWNARASGQRTMSGWSGATPTFGTNPSYFGTAGVNTCSTPMCPVERVSWWDAVVYANVLSVLEGLTPCYTLTGCGTSTGVAGVGGGCSGTSTFCTSGNFSCSGVTFVGKSCSGYRLLTEAEWERAARGGTTTATYNGNLAATDCSGSSAVLDPIAWYTCNSGSRTHAVGQKAANSWGLYDMLGNVWEWTWTWYATSQSGGTDPLGPETGSDRVLRGGSWGDPAQFARAAHRFSLDPGARRHFLGFRLARSAP